MADVKGWPLNAADYWYGSTLGCFVVLLSDSLTGFDDTAGFYSDLTDEIPDQGGYTRGGLSMSTLVTRTYNSTAGVVEFDVGSSTWASSATVTVTGFRWIVLCMAGTDAILGVWDCQGAQTITAHPITFTIPQSALSSGVYPILTLTRKLS